MTVARQANGFICRYGHAFPYPVCLRHVYRRMLAYCFAAAAPRTASGFHDQFSVLKLNRVFRTTSPARAAQYAGFGIESYLCLAKRRKRPAQFTLTGTTLQARTSSRGTCISARRAVLTSLTGICLNAHAASPRRRSARFSRAIASNQSGFCSASILIKRTWCCACHSRSSFTPGARSVNGPTSVSPHRKRFRGVMPVMASAGQTNRQSPHSIHRLSSTVTPESVKKKPAQDRRPRRRGRKRGENGDGRTHASRPSPGQRSIRPSANTEENEAQHQLTDNQQCASQQHGRSRRFQTARSKAQHTRNGYAPAQQMHGSKLLQHL